MDGHFKLVNTRLIFQPSREGEFYQSQPITVEIYNNKIKKCSYDIELSLTVKELPLTETMTIMVIKPGKCCVHILWCT